MCELIKVSIIVPVFNVEKYLKECLSSIVNQSLKEIQIIILNDGSTDHSLDIIKEFANLDQRILLINKKNEGYGKTVNRGINLAKGEFIGIVEPDDFIDEDMFFQLYTIAKQNDCEVVKSCWYNYCNGENYFRSFVPDDNYNLVINPKHKSSVFYSQNSVWSAIYKKDFLLKNKIQFLETPGASFQDVSFSYKVWLMASRAYFIKDAFLHYRVGHIQSISSPGKVFCICEEFNEIEKFSISQNLEKETYRLRSHLLLNNYLWNLNRLTGENKEQFRKVFCNEFLKIKEHGLDKKCFTFKQWIKLCLIFQPESIKYKIYLIFINMFRLIFKSKIKKEKKIFYVFGIIRLVTIDCNLPNIE